MLKGNRLEEWLNIKQCRLKNSDLVMYCMNGSASAAVKMCLCLGLCYWRRPQLSMLKLRLKLTFLVGVFRNSITAMVFIIPKLLVKSCPQIMRVLRNMWTILLDWFVKTTNCQADLHCKQDRTILEM